MATAVQKRARAASIEEVVLAVEGRVAAAVEEVTRLSEARARERKQLRERQERVANLAHRRWQKHYKQALMGLSALMAFAKTPSVQRLIDLCETERRATGFTSLYLWHQGSGWSQRGEFVFFATDYVAEEREDTLEDRHAAVLLMKDEVVFVAHDEFSNGSVFARFSLDNLATLMSVANGTMEKDFFFVSDQLPHAQVEPLRFFQAAKASFRFEYEDLFFRILLDCAQPARLQAYVETALRQLLH